MNIAFERIADGKIRLTTSSWDDAKVLWPNEALEVAIIGRQVGLVRVDKPIAYLDIDDSGYAVAVQCNIWHHCLCLCRCVNG